MICPNCGSVNTKCKDTRQRPNCRYRRYHCLECGKRFSTKERYVRAGAEEIIKQMLKRICNAEMERREAKNQANHADDNYGEATDVSP